MRPGLPRGRWSLHQCDRGLWLSLAAGGVTGLARLIDHLASTPDLAAASREVISNVAKKGQRLTDHRGVSIDLVRLPVRPNH